MGEWREVPGFSLAHLKGFEGPGCYQVEPAAGGKPATWCLVLDHYAKSEGYKPFTTTDLTSGGFASAAGFSFPFQFRHGSVLPLTEEEFERLRENDRK